MEKTSRQPVEHKFKTVRSDNLPTIPNMSNELKNKILKYLNGTKPINRLDRVKAIYNLVDEIIAEMEPMTVCRKGCAWCCAIPVEVMPIEVKYIINKTGLKPQKTGFIPIAGHEHNFGYCPLLDKTTGTCSVYEYRPLNCRAFVVFDSPDYCRRGYEGEEIKHWTNGGPQNGYGNNGILFLGFDLVKTELKKNDITFDDKDYLDKKITDIRCYFK